MTRDELLPLLRQTPRGVTMPCHVQPRSSRCAVAGIAGESVKIALTSPPVEGKANAELCKFLAKAAGLPKSSVQIFLGETSRTKVVLFAGASVDSLLEKLCS